MKKKPNKKEKSIMKSPQESSNIFHNIMKASVTNQINDGIGMQIDGSEKFYRHSTDYLIVARKIGDRYVAEICKIIDSHTGGENDSPQEVINAAKMIIDGYK